MVLIKNKPTFYYKCRHSQGPPEPRPAGLPASQLGCLAQRSYITVFVTQGNSHLGQNKAENYLGQTVNFPWLTLNRQCSSSHSGGCVGARGAERVRYAAASE